MSGFDTLGWTSHARRRAEERLGAVPEDEPRRTAQVTSDGLRVYVGDGWAALVLEHYHQVAEGERHVVTVLTRDQAERGTRRLAPVNFDVPVGPKRGPDAARQLLLQKLEVRILEVLPEMGWRSAAWVAREIGADHEEVIGRLRSLSKRRGLVCKKRSRKGKGRLWRRAPPDEDQYDEGLARSMRTIVRVDPT